MTESRTADDLNLSEDQLATAEPYARRALQAMARGQHGLAVRAVLEHLEQAYYAGLPARRDTSLRACGVGIRTANALEQIEVETIGDLADVGWERIRGVPHLAERGIFTACQAVIQALAPRE